MKKASETDLAPGRGRGPVFPGSRPWKKKVGGVHSQTVPNSICLCSQICTYSNAAINEALFHLWVHIKIVRVDAGPK